MTITQPGLYEMPDDVYLRDPVVGGSASSTVLKAMLPPSCPAKAKHIIDGGWRPPRTHYDVGSAFHAVTLGEGREIAVWDGASQSWQSKDAKQFRADAYAAGKIPLLADDARHVEGMRESIALHDTAGPLLAPGSFTAERAAVWQDRRTGVWCRAKYDAVPHFPPGGRMVIVDLKSTTAADPDSLARSIVNYGYHISAAHYRAGALALGLAAQVDFLAVFAEKTPPYVVSIVPIDGEWLFWGEQLVRDALDLYAHCTATKHWPGHEGDDGVVSVELPRWARYAYERRIGGGSNLGDLS